MNIVFMGTPEFAVTAFRAIHASKHAIVAAVTVPDRQQGRGLHLQPSPVKAAALECGIPVLQPESLRDPAFIAQLRAFNADIFIVVAFRILPEEVFAMPAFGAVNLHASLLPRYRGAAPIQWAIINGERVTGVTSFFIRKSVDTGSIILQRSVNVDADMTAGELHDVLAVMGASALLDTLDAIESGTAPSMMQDDTQATAAPRIFRESARIAWSNPAAAVHNVIRGMNPTPVAWTMHRDSVLRIHRSKRCARPLDGPPGMLRVEDGRIEVACADEAIEILALQQPGHKALDAAAFLRGYKLLDGELFV